MTWEKRDVARLKQYQRLAKFAAVDGDVDREATILKEIDVLETKRDAAMTLRLLTGLIFDLKKADII